MSRETGDTIINWPLKITKAVFTLQMQQLNGWDGRKLEITTENSSKTTMKPAMFWAQPQEIKRMAIVQSHCEHGFSPSATIIHPSNPLDQKPLQILDYEGDRLTYLKEEKKEVSLPHIEKLQIPEAMYAFYEQAKALKESEEHNLKWPAISTDAKAVNIYTETSSSSICTTFRTPAMHEKWGTNEIPDILSHSLVTYFPESQSQS